MTRFVAIIAPLIGVALYVGLSRRDLRSLILWILVATVLASLLFTLAGAAIGHRGPRFAATFLSCWVIAVADVLVLIGLLVCWTAALIGDQFGSNDPNQAKRIAEVGVTGIIALGAYFLNALSRFGYGAFARFVLSLRYESQYPKPTENSPVEKAAPWEALWGGGTVDVPLSWEIPASEEHDGRRTIVLRNYSPTAVSRRFGIIRAAKKAARTGVPLVES